MPRIRLILGLATPLALPLGAVAMQQRWTIFHAPAIGVIIPVGFVLVGIVTGALLRAWWSLAYIVALGAALTLAALVQEEYPGSDSHAIAIALFIWIVPLAMLGAALGLLVAKAIETRSARRGLSAPDEA